MNRQGHLLDILNKEQREAVTTLNGPLLIVAGAGSGKTAVITHRIAHILQHEKDITPANILALTFSRKAADEMQARAAELTSLNPAEFAIATFHSFCHSVLTDHAADIGLAPTFRLLDNVEQIIFLKKLLRDLDLEYYGQSADLSGLAASILRFISRCKDELVTVEDYAGYIKGIKDAQERLRHSEVLAAYRLYQNKLDKSGCMDFGELIIKAISLFKRRKKILEYYRDKFRYILVDEFQDTNISQIELIAMLAAARKNICVVGDDDQAIYRFRGASYASFIKIQEYFPGLKKIKLSQNYRSTKKILRTANKLVKQNDIDRYDPDKSLWTENREGEKVQLSLSPSYTEEARQIIRLIKALAEKGADLSDVAVLYRAHSHKDELLRLLKREHIPHSVSGGAGIFESEEVKETVAYLRALNDAEDSASYFRVASSAEYDIDYADLIRINGYAKYHNIPLQKAMLCGQDIGLGPDAQVKIKNFLGVMKAMKNVQARFGIEEFLYQLIAVKTTILKRAYINQRVYAEPSLRNIGEFYRMVSQYARSRQKADIESVMDYIDTYIEEGGKLESEETVKSHYGVRLMTVHQAKGLEFPYVFVMGLVQNRFPTSYKKEAIAFPDELIKERLPKGNFHLEEERRLFYVALTRAKEMLFLSGVRKSYSRPSVFLNEIADIEGEGYEDNDITVSVAHEIADDEAAEPGHVVPVSSADMIKMQAAGRIAKLISCIDMAGLDDKKSIAAAKKAFNAEFRNMLERLRHEAATAEIGHGMAGQKASSRHDYNVYSFTQIESYNNCPLKYKYTFIDCIPRRPKPYLSLGSIVHDVLKDFYAEVKSGRKPDLKELLHIYNRLWSSSGFRDEREEGIYMARGEKELREFYEKNKESLKPPLYIEKKFILELGGRQFKGFIDRIDELENGTVEIIDYKTGKQKKKSGMQLDLYAIAAIEKLGLDVGKLSFYYMVDNKKDTFRRTTEDLEQTKAKVIEIMSLIEKGDFRPNVTYTCKYCDYQILCPAYKK